MNWELAIKRNRTDLAKIIAGLFVLAGWIPGGERPTFFCRTARNELARLLRVTEAALRRLLVIMATVRKYEVKPAKASARPLPDFSKFGQGKGNRAPVFNLIDPRKPIRFVDEESFYGKAPSGPEPRIWTLEEPQPLVAHALLTLRQAQGEDRRGVHDPDFTLILSLSKDEGVAVSSSRLLRRLEALDQALKTLPRQARRMAKLMEEQNQFVGGTNSPPWQVRQAKRRRSRQTSEATSRDTRPTKLPPIRAGLPPGYVKHPEHEADHVLRECHGLVCDLRGIP